MPDCLLTNGATVLLNCKTIKFDIDSVKCEMFTISFCFETIIRYF